MPLHAAEWPRRLNAALASRAGRRALVALSSGLLLYALVGFLLLPAWLLREIPSALDARLGTRTQLGALAINPFTLTLEARELAISSGEGSPLLAADGLFVDVSAASLFRAALVVPLLRVSGLSLDLAREADGNVPLQAILGALDEPPAPEDPEPGAPPRFLLDRLAVEIAAIRVSDLSGVRPARISIGPLQVAGESLSTLPGRRGRLHLEAALPGEGRLNAEAELALQPFTASGKVALAGLRPALAWDFLQQRVALEPPEGALSLSFDWSLDASLADAGLRLRELALSLDGISLKRPGASSPLLALRRAAISAGELDLPGRTATLGDVSLQEGVFSAALDAGGVLDWETLLTPAPAASAPSAPGDAAAWQFAVSRLGVEGIALDLRDATRRAPLSASARLARLVLSARGRTGPSGIELGVSGATLALEGILGRSEGREEPLARIARLSLEDAGLDLQPRRVQARRLAVEGLEATLTREADGSLREIALVSTRDPGDPLPISHAAATWSLALGEFAATGLGLRLADTSTSPPLAYAVAGGQLTLKGLDTATPAPVAIEAVLPVEQGGRIRLAGSAAGDATLATLQVGIEGLALSPLAPLVARDTTLTLAGGTLSTELALDWRDVGESAPALDARGSLSVDGLLLNEAATGERLLAWRSARASGIDFALQPGRLSVRDLRLVEPGARIIVQADRRTNLSQLMRENAAAVPAVPELLADAGQSETVPPQEAAPFPPVAEAASAAEPFRVSIDRLRVDGGTVDFADLSLVLPFAVRIEQFKGIARGISSADSSRATLKFEGRVGEHGEAEIDGQLAPFDPRRATDIEVAFRNIAVNSFSPYSATFAGRAIRSGDLDLALQYKVDGGRLAGDNQLLLRDLKLGEKVDSPDATSLPLDLAIALLTDSRGRIDIALPVRGNVDDPKFSYGRIVWKAIGNLIAGVATAPFRALGGLFGGAKAEEMQAVQFASGSAELRPRERERLGTLAEALAARPRLGLGVSPGVEKSRDGQALRRLAVRRAHAEALGLELDPGEDPGPVSYADGHSQRALEELLEEREGEEANARFAAQWAKQNGREPRRVNVAVAFLGGDSEDTEYYRALYLYLVRSTPEPVEGLVALGKARSEVILAELARRGVEPARLESGKPAAAGKGQPSGVLLPLSLVPRGGR